MRDTAFALGWTPDQFWPATALDLLAAVAAHNRRHGGASVDDASREALDDMMARFPDPEPAGEA